MPSLYHAAAVLVKTERSVFHKNMVGCGKQMARTGIRLDRSVVGAFGF